MESNNKLSVFPAFLTGGGLCCVKALSTAQRMPSLLIYSAHVFSAELAVIVGSEVTGIVWSA